LTAILGLLMILGLGVPATADAVTVARLVADEQTWVAAGGRVLVVTDEAGGVPRAACAGLVDVVGVEAAAAVSRQPHTAALATAPGAAVPVVTATAGVSDLLGLPALGSQAVLPPSLATELRLDVGDRLTLLPAPWSVSGEFSGEGGPTAATDPLDQPPSGPITVAAVADLGLLGEASSTGVLVLVAPLGLADSCFVRSTATGVEPLRDALPALLSIAGSQPVVSDRLAQGRFVRDYAAEYDARPLRLVPWAAGTALGFVWLLIRWVRRGQDGLYATLGADWSVRAAIRMSEWSCALAVSIIGAWVTAVATSWLLGAPTAVALVHVTRSVLIGAAAATVMAIVATALPLRSPLAALKDR